MDNDTANINLMIQNLPFIEDDDVVGKWEYYDFIESEEQFDIDKENPKFNKKGFKEIYFLPYGQKYWIFEGWTKGFLFTHEGGDKPVICHKYNIKKRKNEIFMFLEMNDYKSNINVLKKVCNKEYRLNEIGIHDNIDLPFILDEHVIGLWKSIDYVDNINDFYVNKLKPTKMWLKSVCFNKDGIAVRVYDNEIWNDKWTKGFLLDTKKVTASAYEIKLIDNIEYLFMEWKMGNYVYGGAKPIYFVFKRCEE